MEINLRWATTNKTKMPKKLYHDTKVECEQLAERCAQ